MHFVTRMKRVTVHPLFAPIVSESAGIDYRTLDVPEQAVSLFGRKPSTLWYLGNTSLLDHTLIGIVSARAAESYLNSRTEELLRELTGIQATFIGGWHSSLEKESLKVLLRESPRVIVCLAKSVNRFGFFQELKTLLNQDRLLLVTHCGPRAKRISRDASLKRNYLVAGLAKALLVLAAPEGSATFKLAASVIQLGKPVFAPEQPANKSLFACGALPATIERIQKHLR